MKANNVAGFRVVYATNNLVGFSLKPCNNDTSGAVNQKTWYDFHLKPVISKRPAISGWCSDLSIHLIFSGHLAP
ncbi:hypothetical protein [Alishewanella sp. HL-SH05]|uniref:hypothetical protein n=1 Tax=Alishewanella sp. HL-SH05 TaxID=3461145 RepID=UPI0040425761